ncbi:MAG: NAD(P)/FAD-dependent oxidoreductase [Candidatus Kapabacteria bacterium]|nr:NAD(P)/FAD-dependent oxidoreductase [Candidatus Kapabacteria bacterium]
MDFDIVIIGGGVIGLSVAAELSDGKNNVLLIERHPSFGNETSSRNSEVIHAGIYYPKDSLKAKLCVPGNESLYEWCHKYNVPHKKIGKYIIAVNKDEADELENIYQRAKNNGVEKIRPASISELKKEEPYVKAYSALFSPDTGIIDSHSLMQSLEFKASENDCNFAWKHTVNGIIKLNDGYEVNIIAPDGEPLSITTKIIINAAGLDSDLIAQMVGIDIDKYKYRLHYCRGHYFRIKSSKKYLVHHLIYPVPQKNSSGLGIHVTVELNGELKLGPDTQYLDERVQNYTVPEELQDKFYQAASSYLTGLDYNDIYPDQSGIRPKLQGKGEPFRDFIIAEEKDKGFPGFINLIGIESPGLTCCLEIAKMVKGFIDVI